MHLQARLARRPQAGRDGEATAVRHLIGLGYRILARNLRFRSGEIDIIAQDRDTVVFVEVRSRGSERHGSPLESIGWRKQVRVIRCAKLWLQRECLTDRVPCRFDVIGVTVPPGRPAARVLRHIRNAFEARE